MACDTCGTLEACPSCKLRINAAKKREKAREKLGKLKDALVAHLACNADSLTRDDADVVVSVFESVRENWYPRKVVTTTDRTG